MTEFTPPDMTPQPHEVFFPPEQLQSALEPLPLSTAEQLISAGLTHSHIKREFGKEAFEPDFETAQLPTFWRETFEKLLTCMTTQKTTVEEIRSAAIQLLLNTSSSPPSEEQIKQCIIAQTFDNFTPSGKVDLDIDPTLLVFRLDNVWDYTEITVSPKESGGFYSALFSIGSLGISPASITWGVNPADNDPTTDHEKGHHLFQQWQSAVALKQGYPKHLTALARANFGRTDIIYKELTPLYNAHRYPPPPEILNRLRKAQFTSALLSAQDELCADANAYHGLVSGIGLPLLGDSSAYNYYKDFPSPGHLFSEEFSTIASGDKRSYRHFLAEAIDHAESACLASRAFGLGNTYEAAIYVTFLHYPITQWRQQLDILIGEHIATYNQELAQFDLSRLQGSENRKMALGVKSFPEVIDVLERKGYPMVKDDFIKAREEALHMVQDQIKQGKTPQEAVFIARNQLDELKKRLAVQ